MRAHWKLSALMTFALLPACGPQNHNSETAAISIGTHNPKPKPPFVVGQGTLVYDYSQSSGMSDLQEIGFHFLWDQYHNKINVYYDEASGGTPDLAQPLVNLDTDYSTEWRVEGAEQTFALIRYDSFEKGKYFTEKDQLPLSAYIVFSAGDLAFYFRAKGEAPIETQEFTDKYDADVALRAFFPEGKVLN